LLTDAADLMIATSFFSFHGSHKIHDGIHHSSAALAVWWIDFWCSTWRNLFRILFLGSQSAPCLSAQHNIPQQLETTSHSTTLPCNDDKHKITLSCGVWNFNSLSGLFFSKLGNQCSRIKCKAHYLILLLDSLCLSFRSRELSNQSIKFLISTKTPLSRLMCLTLMMTNLLSLSHLLTPLSPHITSHYNSLVSPLTFSNNSLIYHKTILFFFDSLQQRNVLFFVRRPKRSPWVTK
jgi:hypothetical protein